MSDTELPQTDEPQPTTGKTSKPRRKPKAKVADTPVAETTPVAAVATAAVAAAPAPAVEALPFRTGEPGLDIPAGTKVVIGITGEPGAGKSALAAEFQRLGAKIIDVDHLGHEIIETAPVKKKLIECFGQDILDAGGRIARKQLAAVAFADAAATADLNRLVSPALAKRTRSLLEAAGPLAVLDAARLHELELNDACKQVVYVRAPREMRLQRVSERGWDEAELARRETALGDADERRRRCHIALENRGDRGLLTAYARTILARALGVDLKARTAEAPTVEAKPDGRGTERHQRSGSGRAGANANASETRSPEARSQEARPERSPEARQGDGREQRDGRNGEQRFERGNHDSRPQAQSAQNGPNNPPPQPEREPVHAMLEDYLRRDLPDLQAEAERLEVRDIRHLEKDDLICEILRRVAGGRQDDIVVEGYIEFGHKDQHAYIRSHLNDYRDCNTDSFVSMQQIRRYGLKPGQVVTGVSRAPRGQERCLQLLAIKTVMGEALDRQTAVKPFDALTPLHATDRLFMERQDDPTDYSLRIIDLVAPIGKGQRGLIVAQPKCGKTVYLQKIANAITTNNPEVELLVLLIDERPEEVTDMQRSVRGEVISSTFDQHASRHVQVAEMAINKAKRLVERGKDVVILLDSITRLARAYNAEAPSSGRIMSGGIEAGALVKPKQFFGAARNIENGGSLTILATALVDTGSLMDTVIFEEFKGTGNMELVLDRRLANKRIFPAVDVAQSGTRKEELIIKSDDEMRRMWALRKFLSDRSPQDAVDFLKGKLRNYKTNIEFLMHVDPDKMTNW